MSTLDIVCSDDSDILLSGLDARTDRCNNWPMNIFRPETLQIEGSLLKGAPTEILSLELSDNDITRLVDPSIGFCTARFMEFEAPVAGWAPEDKAWVRFEDSIPEEKHTQIASLSLDPGGDLYFTIWKSRRLEHADECMEFAEIDELVSHDPSNILQALGIRIVRMYSLPKLSERVAWEDLKA